MYNSDSKLKISIITVAFNSVNTIAATIDSVVSQSYPLVEHIVIDGGSTDGTIDIINELMHSNLVFTSERDAGIYDGMNKGLSKATGDVIGFLNSDDIFFDKYCLENIVNEFKDESIDVCFGDLVYVTFDNKKIVRYWKSTKFIKGDFIKGLVPAHPTFYIRKTVLKKVNCFDLSFKLASDFDFMLRTLERYSFKSIYIPNVLVRMRLGGASNKNFTNIFIQNQEIFKILNKNGIQFNFIKFSINKIYNRIFQYFRCYLLKFFQ
jgi:glycosyltransferase involved in cell wall biosynthesis